MVFLYNNNSTEDTESPIIKNNLLIKNANIIQTLRARFNFPFNQAASYSLSFKNQTVLIQIYIVHLLLPMLYIHASLY